MVGIITAALTAVSTVAGVVAVCRMKSSRVAIVEDEARKSGFEPIGFNVKGILHWLGLLPTLIFPSLLFAAWFWLIARALQTGVTSGPW